MSPETARAARELQMLEAMVDCAYELGMAFGAAAQAEADMARSLELLEAFQKSALAVRMGIRLSMTLRAPPRATAAPAVAAERAEAFDREPADREAAEAIERPERERERDHEPVSLPRFLATLGVVARDAGRLPDHAAAHALPTLKGLLAQAKDAPPDMEPAAPSTAAGVAVLARAPQAATRRQLLGSAAASPPRGPPRGPPLRPG